MRKILLLIFAIFGILGFIFYTISTAPSKLSQVELIVAEKHGNWKDKISQFVVSIVTPGQEITPQLIDSIREQIEELPWVKRAQVGAKGDKLIVRIWESSPLFYIAFNGEFYLVGDNDFILSKGKRRSEPLPVYYYRGKNPPFSVEKGFLKLKKTVKMEIKLANNRIKELSWAKEPPQVILSDAYVTLVFKRGKVIIHLGAERNSWDRCQEFTSRAGSVKPGVYDFRFFDMMVKGRNE